MGCSEIMFRIADREEWHGESPRKTTPLPHPIQYVRYIVNTGTPKCFNHEECSAIVRNMQKEHMESGLDDIRYNFLVSDDGTVYEGRGWFSKPPFEPYYADYDGKYMEIAYIGDYSKIVLTNKWHEGKMNERGMELLYYAVECKYLHNNFRYLPIETIEELKAQGIEKPEIEPIVEQTEFDEYGFAPGEVQYLKEKYKTPKPTYT